GHGSVPPDGVALFVGYDVNDAHGFGQPIATAPLDLSSDPTAGPCGAGYYGRVGTSSFFAFVTLGADASDADRQIVVDAYSQLQPTLARPEEPAATAPGYVIAGGGDVFKNVWRVEIRPAPDPATATSGHPFQMSLVRADGTATQNVGVLRVGGIPSTGDIEYLDGDGIWFGAVRRDATSLSFQPEGGAAPIAATLIDLPPSLGATFDGFVVGVPGDEPGSLQGQAG